MPLEREVLPDRPEAREKFPCAFWVAKAAHATLAFARWLVAVLGAVVQSRGRFDEHVLDVCKFRDLRFCRRIAAQLKKALIDPLPSGPLPVRSTSAGSLANTEGGYPLRRRRLADRKHVILYSFGTAPRFKHLRRDQWARGSRYDRLR
ncbi:hypothetical protein AWB67_07447 [Caballeronia terrestris]|uniref:Uncharacterized protein n=1 Tax=Caballeronia terrestris TaxID=1226301 RepID=A0A158L447_9BURK|nr:hypothetical protein AWB67_07447 [Caballeronia terrestris]